MFSFEPFSGPKSDMARKTWSHEWSPAFVSFFGFSASSTLTFSFFSSFFSGFSVFSLVFLSFNFQHHRVGWESSNIILMHLNNPMSWQLVMSNDPMLRSGSCHLSSQPSQMASQPAQGNKKKRMNSVCHFFWKQRGSKEYCAISKKKSSIAL